MDTTSMVHDGLCMSISGMMKIKPTLSGCRSGAYISKINSNDYMKVREGCKLFSFDWYKFGK